MKNTLTIHFGHRRIFSEGVRSPLWIHQISSGVQEGAKRARFFQVTCGFMMAIR